MEAITTTSISLCLVSFLLVASSLLAVRGDDPYRFYTWNITFGDIYPLGVKQQGIMINGQFPGPQIDAVTNDNIIINVFNNLPSPFLLSWQGIQQRRSSWQDGVYGTNCPIPPGGNFTYIMQFKDQIGSYYYFPSLAFHKAAGGYGGIRVLSRPGIPVPFPPPAGDFTILAGDWFKLNHTAQMSTQVVCSVCCVNFSAPAKLKLDFMQDLQGILDSGNDLPPPDGLLINGQGWNGNRFTVDQGRTYRFRVSNVGIATSVNIRIQGHSLLLVEVEGSHTVQSTYTSIDVHLGQSYSFLVTADQPPQDYNIIVSTRFTNPVLTTTAVLHYSNSNGVLSTVPPPAAPTIEIDWSLNQARSIRWNLTASGPRPNPQGSYHYGLVNTTRTMRLANSRASINGKLRYAVNSVSFIPADTPLKVADFYNIQGVFTLGSMPDNPTGGGAYLQTAVMAANMRDYVEVIFENPENFVQSWHIDGYAFWVVGMDGGQWTPASRQSYNLRDAVARYTLQVYPQSWTALYMPLDNVGMWNVSDSTEERVLNTLWKKYENALDKAEKEKALQIFVLQFVQTFRDWGPYHVMQFVDQELGSDETVVGCSHGHPSEIILILIQEISIIASIIAESGSSPESSPNYSEQQGDLGISNEQLHVLECLAILTRSMRNCRVFSYYGGVKKVTSLLKAAVAQLKTLNSLLSADDNSSCQAVEHIKMMLNMIIYIVTIISNFMKLEPTVARVPHFLNSTKYASSKNHLTTVTPSTSESAISDTLRHWQQRAIVLVMEAGGVNLLVDLLRVTQRLNLKDQWTDLSLHFITLCTLRSTISGTRAQNHFRSIGGLEILLDGLGLPSSKFSVSKHLSIPKDERFGNVNNLQILCENGRVHKFANCICWPAFMILEFHRRRDNARSSLALDSTSGPICFLDIAEWSNYSIKLSSALCSFVIPSKDINYCPDEIACNKISLSIPSAYREQSVRWIIRVLMTVFLCIKACTSETELPNHIKILSKTLQLYMIRTFRRVLVSKPSLLTAFREEGVWDLIFSENCFYFGSSVEDIQVHSVTEIETEDAINNNMETTDSESLYLSDVNILQLEAISFLEFAATLSENKYNLPECSALLDALEHCISDPVVVSILLKSFRVILQLATEQTLVSFKSLDVITGVLKAACRQAKKLQNLGSFSSYDVTIGGDGSQMKNIEMSSSEERTEHAVICIELALSLFKEYVTISSYGRILILHNPDCIEYLFNLFQEKNFHKDVLEQILALFRVKLCIFQILSFDIASIWNYNILTVYFNQLPPSSKQDHAAKLQLCSKYLESFTEAHEKEKVNSKLLVDLLVSMREIIMMDRVYYQNLFRDGGCFLHIISLLNGTFNEATGEQLVLNLLETLTLLLEGNDTSKNEDVVILVLNILQKSSTSLQHFGLLVLQQLLKQSIANRTSCFRAGLLSFLLDWFSVEERDDTVVEIAELIQIIGAHSISGKDIRKIFALLRCEKIGAKKKHTSLLLTCLSHMLKEKGPEAFFEFNGHDSGIEIKSPFQWPYNRGLSFSCWLRVENFPENGMMGLFSFFTEDGKGCSAVLSKSALVYEYGLMVQNFIMSLFTMAKLPLGIALVSTLSSITSSGQV
uniref:Plastocyanin-like domain-containing protein n=1 Tax=Leersia perrieri TaxID=77586 RepID=A0A0D9WT98_9ORYZ